MTDETVGEAYRVAKIFSLGPLAGLFNECAAFMELSFLRITIQPGGIPAMLPADLGSSEKWAEVVRSVQSAAVDEHGLLQIKLVSDAGSALIDLLPQPDSITGYRVKAVSFDEGKFSRKIEVLDYARWP